MSTHLIRRISIIGAFYLVGAGFVVCVRLFFRVENAISHIPLLIFVATGCWVGSIRGYCQVLKILGLAAVGAAIGYVLSPKISMSLSGRLHRLENNPLADLPSILIPLFIGFLLALVGTVFAVLQQNQGEKPVGIGNYDEREGKGVGRECRKVKP